MPSTLTVHNLPDFYSRLLVISSNSPRFKAAKKRGEFIKPLPYDRTFKSIDRPLGSGYYSTSREDGHRDHYSGGSVVNQSDGAQTHFPLGWSIGQLTQICVDRVHAGAMRKEIDLGVFLGEIPETYAFLNSALPSIGRAFKYLRKKDPASAVRVLYSSKMNKDGRLEPPKGFLNGLTEVAKAWLSAQYALKPIMNDVYDAVRILDEGYKRDPYLIFAATHVERRPLNIGKNWSNGSNIDTYVGHVEVSSKAYMRVTNPLTYTLEQVGLTNPAAVAWELVPLSFVFDWFVPLGTYISNMKPPSGLELIRRYTYQKWDVTLTGISDYSNLPWNQGAMRMIQKEKEKHRIIYDGWPVPVDPLDRIRTITGLSQMTSAASLLTLEAKSIKSDFERSNATGLESNSWFNRAFLNLSRADYNRR